MDPRFLDDLRHEAYTLSREAVPFLERQLTADDRKSETGLRRTAAHTRLTTLLMDAVAWLALLDLQNPDNRHVSLATRVAPQEGRGPDDLEPALADLIRRVVIFHRRLEHIEAQLDSGLAADPAFSAATPAVVSPASETPVNA